MQMIPRGLVEGMGGIIRNQTNPEQLKFDF